MGPKAACVPGNRGGMLRKVCVTPLHIRPTRTSQILPVSACATLGQGHECNRAAGVTERRRIQTPGGWHHLFKRRLDAACCRPGR